MKLILMALVFVFGALQPLPYVSNDVLMKRIDVLGRRGGMPLDILKNKTT